MSQTVERTVRFPWRIAALVAGVALAIILPFLVVGPQITAWAQTVIEQAGRNRLLAGCLLAGLLATDIVVPVPSSLVSTTPS